VEVNPTTTVRGQWRRTAAVASTPFIPGIDQSMTTTSMGCWASDSSAAAADRASPTTSTPGASAKTARSIRHSTALSSTSMSFTGLSDALIAGERKRPAGGGEPDA
jgi:hypothetical protein